MTIEMASHKKPGAVSRPGAAREFQFREYSDLPIGVKRLEALDAERGSRSANFSFEALSGLK
jgi:hypothetical protein